MFYRWGWAGAVIGGVLGFVSGLNSMGGSRLTELPDGRLDFVKESGGSWLTGVGGLVGGAIVGWLMLWLGVQSIVLVFRCVRDELEDWF